MGKVNFTTERVNSFQCEPGKKQSIFWDAKIPGLGLRVTSAGARSYIFESRLHGKTVRTTIGDPRTWTISQAQAEATSLKSLTDKGIDPREQKAELRVKAEAARAERKRRNVTLGGAWPIYLEARQKKWSSSHYQAHVSVASSGGEQRRRGQGVTTAGPLASLMPLPLSELTSDRIGQWLAHESAQRPTFASLSFRLLRAFASWASDMPAYADLIPENAFSSRRVRDALPKYAAKEGDALQREQLPAWFNAVRNIPNAVISAYLQGLLITGARREELAQLRWEDVDFQWRSLTIRDKVEGARVIPLPTYLSTLISNLPRRNEWVFSSPTAANGRLTEPRIAHTKALAAAGLPHISLHGLRRSFGTLCEWVEMPSGVSAQIMGHKPSALAEKHYRRRPLDLLRMWHDKIEAWMLEQAGIGNSEE